MAFRLPWKHPVLSSDTAAQVPERGMHISRAAVLVAIGLAFIAFLGFIIFDSEDPSGTTVALLEALLSWPVAATLISLVTISVFRPEVATFLSNLAELTLPGVRLSANRAPEATTELIDARIREAIQASLEPLKSAPALASDPAAVQELVDSTIERTSEQVRKARSFTVDFRPLLGEAAGTTDFTYEQFATVSAFLNHLFLQHLRGHVPSFSYGRAWLLRNAEDGQEYPMLGSLWSRATGSRGTQPDTRSLSEVGILPGRTLEVIPVHGE